MQPEPVDPFQKNPWGYGILIPNVIALVLMGIAKLISTDETTVKANGGVFVFAVFVIVPVLMGLVSAYVWRNAKQRTVNYIGLSIINSLVVVLLSAIFLREGVFCLLILSPLLVVEITAGALIGKLIFRNRNNTLNVSLFGALLVVFAVDLLSDHEFTAKVSDTMIVNAPVEKVWPLVVEYEPITAEEKYWFFRIGMPSPVQSTVDGHEAGAGRKCIFSNGYVFDEKMIVYKPNEELTFDITHQPRDPEIMGHIDILRGQFLLKDNGDGTTTLIGNSWYKLYVFPAVYFDAWAESVTRNVHLRVMDHIKTQAESGV